MIKDSTARLQNAIRLLYCIKVLCHSLICITCNLLSAEPHILGKACTPLWTLLFQHSRNTTSIHRNVLSQTAPGQQFCNTSEGQQLFTSAQPPRLQWKLFFPLEIVLFYLTSAWQWEHPSLLRLPIKATKCYESKKDLFLEFSFHILGKKTPKPTQYRSLDWYTKNARPTPHFKRWLLSQGAALHI